MATATAIHNIGKVVQVIGPVLDVEFEAEHLPELYNALDITAKAEDGSDIRVVSESNTCSTTSTYCSASFRWCEGKHQCRPHASCVSERSGTRHAASGTSTYEQILSWAGDGLEQPAGDLVGIRVEEPDPAQIFNPGRVFPSSSASPSFRPKSSP